MRKILVTGGCGFIGCNFIRHLLKTHADYAVVNLDKLTYAGNLDSIADFADDPRHRFVQADICEESTVDSLVAECDMVVNFAAESHVDRSIMGGAEFIQTNVYGTYVLLEASRLHGIERFLQISTDEVYGTLESGLWTESSPLEPRSPYSASKASAELMTQAFHVTHGLPTVITRASNNIGPFQYPEKRVPLFITNAMDDLPIPVYGDGMQIRDHLHVDDHCAAIDLVLHSGVEGEAYNVGGENEATGIDVPARSSSTWKSRNLSSSTSKTGPDTTNATPWTRAKLASSDGNRPSMSTRRWPEPSIGTSTTKTGGARSSRETTIRVTTNDSTCSVNSVRNP